MYDHIFFFYSEGIVHQHAVEPGSSVSESYYSNALRTMVQHIKRKNARPHIARCVLYVSQQNTVEILPQPPYSPDLPPCDLWLFPYFKKPLRSKRKQQRMCKGCVGGFETALTKRTYACF
ncbi:histone-lysine N-methyltransferase SETMAR [Trichonephila clavipes]|nr:histone-lysine N-methyltransferase SETMAR [Trichonephila clavipes]